MLGQTTLTIAWQWLQNGYNILSRDSYEPGMLILYRLVCDAQVAGMSAHA
jgi:hypothetical protein